MLRIQDVKGVIFDVDDTLLDNGSYPDPTKGLHALSRLEAVHEVGRLHGIRPLQNLTPEENVEGFCTAKHHTLASAVWNIMYQHGVVKSDEIDPDNELLLEITSLKTKNHEAVLRKYGEEVTDAGKFVRSLATGRLEQKMAIASAAVRTEIDIFLDMTNLKSYFPTERIIALENVTRFKPDPECFDLAFQTLNIDDNARRQVLAFEDDPRRVQSAKAAGLYVCAITTRFKSTTGVLQDAGADVVADSYAEFAAALGVFLKL